MVYNFDTYYLNKVDFAKLVTVAASFVSTKTEFYNAELTLPADRTIAEKVRQGALPEEKREEFIKHLVDWLIKNSLNQELFKLMLYNEPASSSEPMPFDHHDDSCCWVLNLSESDFEEFKLFLESHSLPVDLFYKSTESVLVKNKGILGILGFQKSYTPKEYEAFCKVQGKHRL